MSKKTLKIEHMTEVVGLMESLARSGYDVHIAPVYTMPTCEKDIELKPCPFCGGKAKLKEDTQCWGHGMFIKEYFVKCIQCGGKSRTSAVYDISEDVAKATAIDAWNTRGDNNR